MALTLSSRRSAVPGAERSAAFRAGLECFFELLDAGFGFVPLGHDGVVLGVERPVFLVVGRLLGEGDGLLGIGVGKAARGMGDIGNKFVQERQHVFAASGMPLAHGGDSGG